MGKRAQVRTGTQASLRTLVAPPRLISPRFEGLETLRPDIGDKRRAAIAPQALSIGIPGLVEIDADPSGVSVSTPVGGVTLDDKGVAVDAGKAGRISVGPGGITVETGMGRVEVGRDGATVGTPNGGGVTVGTDGSVRVTPPTGGGGNPALPGFPDLSIPVPKISFHTIEIPLPVPKLVMEPMIIPYPLPRLEPIDLPRVPFPQAPGVPQVQPAPKQDIPPLELIDPLAKVIGEELTAWQPLARFADLTVQGMLAFGAAGCLKAPRIEPFILSHTKVAGLVGEERDFARAVAEAVSDGLEAWQDQLVVPGLPWYPAFAAWPGPFAPPLPNVPCVLAACPSPGTRVLVSGASLGDSIVGRLPAAKRDRWRDRARLVAVEAGAIFIRFLVTRQIVQVLGEGRIPGFSPNSLAPVPIGAVVDGRAWSPGPSIV